MITAVSLAQFKRQCVTGRQVFVTNHYRPSVSGLRTIQRSSSSGLTMTPPEGETAKTFRTTLDWPKARDCVVSSDSLIPNQPPQSWTLTIWFAADDARRARQIAATGSPEFITLTLLPESTV